MKRFGWRLIPVGLFFLLGIFLWRGLSLDPHNVPSVQIGRPVPDFTLPELQNPDSFINSGILKEQVALLNVWASWCEACVEEQVFMLQLARDGVPIYGLNYKDKTNDALQWLTQWGNPYKLIVQDSDGTAAIDLGVYGAPETFVIDKKGIIRYRHVGVMTQQIWTDKIAPLMNQLERSS
ncbi:MAG TPA: DsbE family thiol:disulfide interchange protein [Legionella sp.]|nr:DsbE family thiol:disulfide interchange protein [Legionella sp.]